MQFYHFSEQPYPDAWELGLESLRNTIPNSLCDPEIASRIYHERLDEYRLCDELGINIMVNEHHVSATCISPSPTLHLAMLARETKNVRLLGLGIPLANRSDPLRVAEELAMIDVISRGRLEIGFVKGAPFELSPANSNPGRFMERFWESHDLIVKLLSTRDGPFNWEGESFHYRQANIWPRPWQQPAAPKARLRSPSVIAASLSSWPDDRSRDCSIFIGRRPSRQAGRSLHRTDLPTWPCSVLVRRERKPNAAPTTFTATCARP
jgi:Luciferase-like monooxygenase